MSFTIAFGNQLSWQPGFEFFEEWRHAVMLASGYARRHTCRKCRQEHIVPTNLPAFSRENGEGLWPKQPGEPLFVLFGVCHDGPQQATIEKSACLALAKRLKQLLDKIEANTPEWTGVTLEVADLIKRAAKTDGWIAFT